MKIKDTFLMKEIAGNYVVVPTGNELVNLNGMITLNDSGAVLWGLLENDTTKDAVIGGMLEKFDIDRETAEADIDEFLDLLRKIGALDE
ncbi:MAG: PqqD family protein [Clostridia bacterium]|nr:PqqD family protein [Clostridia bacterium]